MSPLVIRPQPGPQWEFFASSADVVVYGGAAGGGKSWAVLTEPMRHAGNSGFRAVVFRRNSTQVFSPGGLWDEATKLYAPAGAEPNHSAHTWTFPSGASIAFRHIQHEQDKLKYQGMQAAYIAFDELTHFTESQFFYMLSRNRSTCGVRPYVRASTNPDADSWVRRFIDWWIGDDGFPVAEHAGRLRYFGRDGDEFVWGDSREEVHEKAPHLFDGALEQGAKLHNLIKSVTFIPASVRDNQAMLRADPAYLAGLNALSKVDRARLRDGNWDARPRAGDMFERSWFPIVRAVPAKAKRLRFWDFAATEKSDKNADPDWTVGALVAEHEGVFYIEDIRRFRASPGGVETRVQNTAQQDGKRVRVRFEQEPGSAGKAVASHLTRRVLKGFNAKGVRSTGSKVERAKTFSAAAEAGNVCVVEGPWNEAFFSEVDGFPDVGHDDQVDAVSGAFNELNAGGYSLADMVR